MLELAVILGTSLPLLRLAVVATAIRREIHAADERCGAGIAAGRVKDMGGIEQEYTMVRRATDSMFLLMLDLRKWTHRQFFPHGSAR